MSWFLFILRNSVGAKIVTNVVERQNSSKKLITNMKFPMHNFNCTLMSMSATQIKHKYFKEFTQSPDNFFLEFLWKIFWRFTNSDDHPQVYVLIFLIHNLSSEHQCSWEKCWKEIYVITLTSVVTFDTITATDIDTSIVPLVTITVPDTIIVTNVLGSLITGLSRNDLMTRRRKIVLTNPLIKEITLHFLISTKAFSSSM